jgi:hypothetical protein
MYFMYLICTKNKLFSSSKWPICATITGHIYTFSSLIKYSRETLYPGTLWCHVIYRNKPLFQISPAIITLVFLRCKISVNLWKKMGLNETSVFIKVSFCLAAAGFLLHIIGFATAYWISSSVGGVKSHQGLWRGCVSGNGYSICSSGGDQPSKFNCLLIVWCVCFL